MSMSWQLCVCTYVVLGPFVPSAKIREAYRDRLNIKNCNFEHQIHGLIISVIPWSVFLDKTSKQTPFHQRNRKKT